MPNDKFTVIRDTSEKKGWYFPETDSCAGMVEGNLYTGDYTIVGAENKVIIERKGSVSEFAININQPRFEDELKRLEDFDIPVLIAEFSFAEIMRFPDGLPEKVKSQIKVTPSFIIKKIAEYQTTYKTKILFCNDKFGAFTMARSILKRAYEKYIK